MDRLIFSFAVSALLPWAVALPGNARCDSAVDSDPLNYAREFVGAVDRFTIPEYARMKGVLVAFLYEDSLGNSWQGFGVPDRLLASIAQKDTLFVLVSPPDSPAATTAATDALTATGANMGNVQLIPMLLDTWWTRDYGPFWQTQTNVAGDQEVLISDLIYDRVVKVEWDFGGCRVNDNTVPGRLAHYFGVPLELSGVVHSGGNLMINADGVAVSTDGVYSDNQASQSLFSINHTRAQFDDRLKKYLGLTDIKTMPDPQATYIDHVDTWAKFLPDGSIAVGQVPSVHDDFAKLEEIVQLIEEWNVATLIHRVPMAVAKASDANKTVSGYFLNCLIVNQRLFVPTINSTDEDEVSLNNAALTKWREIMGSDFEVFGFDYGVATPDAVETSSTWHQWFTWDALHCRAKGVPDIASLVDGYTWPWEIQAPTQAPTQEAAVSAAFAAPLAFLAAAFFGFALLIF